jgi:hypothetical protein
MGYIVTDLWWFDQVTAALYPTRIVLFVNSPLGVLATCPDAHVFIVRSGWSRVGVPSSNGATSSRSPSDDGPRYRRGP